MSASVTISLPGRRGGKTMARQHMLQSQLLRVLHEAGGSMSFTDILTALPATRRELFLALDAQAMLGNVRRHYTGDPVVMTRSCRVAMDAALQRELAA